MLMSLVNDAVLKSPKLGRCLGLARVVSGRGELERPRSSPQKTTLKKKKSHSQTIRSPLSLRSFKKHQGIKASTHSCHAQRTGERACSTIVVDILKRLASSQTCGLSNLELDLLDS